MTKYLFPFLTAVGTRVLGAVDACWAAVALLSPSRKRVGQKLAVDNVDNPPSADTSSRAPGALLSGLTLPQANISQKNA